MVWYGSVGMTGGCVVDVCGGWGRLQRRSSRLAAAGSPAAGRLVGGGRELLGDRAGLRCLRRLGRRARRLRRGRLGGRRVARRWPWSWSSPWWWSRGSTASVRRARSSAGRRRRRSPRAPPRYPRRETRTDVGTRVTAWPGRGRDRLPRRRPGAAGPVIEVNGRCHVGHVLVLDHASAAGAAGVGGGGSTAAAACGCTAIDVAPSSTVPRTARRPAPIAAASSGCAPVTTGIRRCSESVVVTIGMRGHHRRPTQRPPGPRVEFRCVAKHSEVLR